MFTINGSYGADWNVILPVCVLNVQLPPLFDVGISVLFWTPCVEYKL